MKRKILQYLIPVCIMIFVLGSLAYAAPVGKITKLEGRVDVLKAGQNAVAGVSLGDNVDVGDIFRAKTNSRAEITFFNRNILRIHPATRVQVSQYSDDGTRSNQVMKMDRGKVEAVSSKEFVKKVSSFAEGNKFEVHTPNAVAGIRGSGMTVGFAQMITGLFFSTGRGYFYNPNQPAIIQNVSAGFISFIAGAGGMPSRPVPGSASYVGGSGGSAPGTGTGSTGSNLNLQTVGVVNPISQTLVTTPPPQVPNVYVGGISHLSGSVGSTYWMYVQVDNVKFYGPSTTSAPQTWTAASVTGQSSGAPISSFVGETVTLSACGNTPASAKFTIGSGSGSGGTYSATLTNGSVPGGVGAYKQPVTFSGTSTGTYTTNSFSGTASGTAK